MSPTNQSLTIIKEFLVKKLSPYVLYLFGSQAKQQVHSDSDFDIAFLSDEEFDTYEIFMIAQELAAVLNKDVDLIDLKKASTVFQAQVVNTGRILYCSDDLKRSIFEMYTLKKYTRLNEERAEILENFVRRGIHNE